SVVGRRGAGRSLSCGSGETSLSWGVPHARRAERQVSGAPESRSVAEAGGCRLQTLVRQSLEQRLRLSMFFPAFFFHRPWPRLLGVRSMLVLAFRYCRLT